MSGGPIGSIGSSREGQVEDVETSSKRPSNKRPFGICG